MGLRRRGDRCYGYRSVREGRRVRTEYVGSGPLVEAVQAEADARRAQIREDIEHERELVEYGRWVDRVVADALVAAGYWRPGRHGWRRRRAVGRGRGASPSGAVA